MQSLQTIANRRQVPWLRALTLGLGVCLFAALSPIIWLALTGGVGLLVLGAVLATGFALVQALPLLGQKLENRLLAHRKAEARRNPIEQLQNEVLRRGKRLREFRQALVTVGGQIESIQGMLEDSYRKSPGLSLVSQEKALKRLQQFHQLNLSRLGQAHAAFKDFQDAVKNKESQWAITNALSDMTEAMDPHAADQLTQDLLTDTALRTVQDRFNEVFAELDVQMCSLDGPTCQLLAQPAQVPFEIADHIESKLNRSTE